MINNCAKFTSGKAFFIKGQPYWGSSLTLIENQASGLVKAIDVDGQDQWESVHARRWSPACWAPPADWSSPATPRVSSPPTTPKRGGSLDIPVRLGTSRLPITYALDGRQYIAVCVGWGGWTAASPEMGPLAPECPARKHSLRLRLPEEKK